MHRMMTVIFSCNQADLWMVLSVCPSVRPSVCPSEVKGQGHRGQNPICPFPDCNSNWNSSMATKWCIKLEWVYKRCPIFFKVVRIISRSREDLDCKMGAKFYLFAQNYEKWRSNFYIFTPNYEKLRSKVAKISKFPKRDVCLNSTIKKPHKKQGVKFDSRLKGGTPGSDQMLVIFRRVCV